MSTTLPGEEKNENTKRTISSKGTMLIHLRQKEGQESERDDVKNVLLIARSLKGTPPGDENSRRYKALVRERQTEMLNTGGLYRTR